ncbi:SRPBCC family protein [bacterium]|jgi:carbon monoxide dehydrogenase subunit G|nr:SRPBCC family protein [bacterium]
MTFHGKETFAAPAETVFARLLDMDFMAGGLSDVVSVDKKSDEEMTCKIRPGFSFLRGTLDVHFRVADKEPPRKATMSISNKGIGVSMAMETTMEVIPSPDGTTCEVIWESQIKELGGLLKSVSKGLIQGAAGKVSADVWAGVHRRMNA